MKVLSRRMLQAHNSRLVSHWFLSSVASWEAPEKLELSELILNPDLGFRFTVAYAISFQQRSSPPTLACVRCYGLIPRRWDEALAVIMQRGKPEEKPKPLFGDMPAVALAIALNRKHQGTSKRTDDFLRARALQGGWFS
jgi:hypothetical protein